MYNSQMLSNSLYRIEAELGSGGGGIVYKAWHTRLQKYVVIKELKRGTRNSIETQRNEVEALKNVKSAYLPQVLDFFSENERVFTVMEYIDGVSFDKLLEKNQRFSQSQVVKWYGQLASALEIIHRQNIAHRDIKPANIMLLPNGDVCLIDFNAALVGGNDVRLISRSLGYASPEQYEIYEKYKHTVNAPIRYTTSNTINQYSVSIENQSDNIPTELLSDANLDTTERLENTESDFTDNITLSRAVQTCGSEVEFGKTELIKPMINENIDWKLSDIFSLGASMYHLLTGLRPPVKMTDVIKLSSVGKYDEGLAYIIENSMRLNPTDRIPSAAVLLETVRNIYKYDSRWKAIQVKQIAASIILPLLFSGCLLTAVQGYNKIGQEKEELYYSDVYEIQNGDEPDKAYLRAIELFGERIDPYFAMAQRYWNEGNLEECGEYIRTNLGKIAVFQSDKMSYEALGGIYYILGDCFYYQSENRDYQNAKLNYALAVKYAPSNPDYHRDYAITLARLGDTESARNELNKAQRLNLDIASLNLLNGEIDYADNKLDAALEYFSKTIALSDDDYIRYRAYHSSDEIYKTQGRFSESVKLLSDSLNKIPLRHVNEMKERLGDSYYRNGDNTSAILIFEELAEVNTSYNVQQNLVILYQNENEFEKASTLLRSMRESFPMDYRVPMRQAFLETDIQANLDNEIRDYSMTAVYYAEAEKLYEENFKSDESDPEMQQLRAIIEQLKDNGWIK
ncbi:MAG: serine/threonine-protein kinase [Eubacterium sp.]|nr:serine/threonine-protein kinase [Eubacterium sp.]